MYFIFIVKDYINLEEIAVVGFNDADRMVTVQFKDSVNDPREYPCNQEEYAAVKKLISDKLGKLLV